MTDIIKTIGIPTLGMAGNIDLATIPKVEDCSTGFDSLFEYNLVVAPPVLSDKISGTSIILTDSAMSQLENAAQAARIIQMSPLAFNYDNYGDNPTPKVGDLIWFSRHSGGQFTGADGKAYRIIKDKDVMGKLKE